MPIFHHIFSANHKQPEFLFLVDAHTGPNGISQFRPTLEAAKIDAHPLAEFELFIDPAKAGGA